MQMRKFTIRLGFTESTECTLKHLAIYCASIQCCRFDCKRQFLYRSISLEELTETETENSISAKFHL